MLKAFFTASDEQLMWRVKLKEDHHAFATLMDRWQAPIRNLCTRMTGDSHEAEDLCQTAFARVFARRAHWEPTGKFSTFLWRVALNLCHDTHRHATRRAEWLAAFDQTETSPWEKVAADEASPDARAAANEEAELVQRAMHQLRPLHREVVALRHYEGMKFAEIADVLGVPQGTVKSRMAEALTHLHELLKTLDHPKTAKIQRKDLIAL
jgi:RNA polymerase sigma-70 factor (ECF subfamily)